jgi:hypothetical protein
MHPNLRASRRTALALAMGMMTMAANVFETAHAAGSVSIFKIVTPKDEVFVGVPEDELAKLGAGAPVEALAKKIAADGQMTLWQYAVKHNDKGDLVHAPLAKISIFAAGVVRIEPYKPAYPVVAPTQ